MASGGSSEGKQLSPIEVCTACDTGDQAEHYCAECQEYLCAECTKSHRRQRKTKEHTLTGLKYTDSVKAKNYNPCPEHEGNFINKFCGPCFKIGCELCMTQNHYTHKFVEISNYSEAIYNLCLDKTKELQGPFNKLNSAKTSIEQDKQSLINNCDKTEKEIVERKEKIIEMATQMADEALDTLKTIKQERVSKYTKTSDELDKVLLQCKSIATPLGLGTDFNSVIKRMISIDSEINEANSTLASVDQLEGKSKVTLSGDDVFKKIEESTQSYLQIQDCDKVSCIPIVRPRKTVLPSKDAPTKHFEPSLSSLNKDTIPSNVNKSGHTGLPDQLTLINKTEVDWINHISRHVESDSFVTQESHSGPISRLSFTTDVKQLEPSSYGVEPFIDYGRGILTVSYDRHVIISEDAINLCDNSKIIHSEKHGEDKYVPDAISYVNKQRFMTLCTKAKKIRYHDAHTLKVLNTHDLCTNWVAPFCMLCTNNGNVLLPTQVKELTQFTHDGVKVATVPIHDVFFKCTQDSICIDPDNNIFGVQPDDFSINVFGLKGQHKILGKVDCTYFWTAGLDNDRRLYLSDSSQFASFIGKYAY